MGNKRAPTKTSVEVVLMANHFVPNSVRELSVKLKYFSRHDWKEFISFTICGHNIVKRFRGSGEISVRKGQWKPLLNVCDLWALRLHCMRNHHVTMLNIVTWAQEYSQQLTVAEMEVETVLHREEAIYKLCADKEQQVIEGKRCFPPIAGLLVCVFVQ